jgi:CIC family chloride channel protein
MTKRLSGLQQLRLREHQLFIALSILVGVLAGLSAVLFAISIDLVTRTFFGNDPSRLRLFGVPTLVSLVTGVLLVRVFPGVRGSGVPQTKTAFHLHNGNIPARVPIGKFLTGVLCIGSGHSMGREGPSAQIGAGIASMIGRWLHLSPQRVKELIPIGAAGALSAAFNTPVAAVIFSLEEIIGDLNATLLGSTVVASVAAVVVERAILGNEPLFHVPTYHLVHPAELLGYAALGVLGGIVSIAFCKLLLSLRSGFLRLPQWTRMLQPAIGGLGIGLLLLVAPEVRGVGYDIVGQALNGGLLLRTMAILCALKLVATIVSYASGNAGGIFAPSLYIGAMAGGAVGMLVHRYAPFPTGDPGAYALVGMGTLFAGIVRAPMTSVFMIFEITQDYQILVPLMVANLLSFMISRRYQPVPVYHALLEQDGVHLPTGPAREAATWAARDVMGRTMTFLAPQTSVAVAWRRCQEEGLPAYLVGTAERYDGTITSARLAEAVAEGRSDDAIDSLLDGASVHAHPDHPLDVVLERFAQSGGVLPIVSRANAHQVEGAIELDDITRWLQRRPARQPVS